MLTQNLEFINPADLYDPVPNGYTHIVITPAHKVTVYIAGQGGEDVNGTLSNDFFEQLKQAFKNLKIALASASVSPSQVAKINTFIVDHNASELAALTAVILDIWGDKAPAQTLIPVPRLALDGMLFEVEAIAVIPDN